MTVIDCTRKPAPTRRSAAGFAVAVLAAWLVTSAPGLPFREAVAATEPSRQGVLTGAKMSEHPDWFKESFLEIAEDVAEAADDDKHVMLFLHLNGCPYCYKMVEENIKHAPYTDFIRENFDVIALNIRGDREVAFNDEISMTEKALAEHLEVAYTPTVIFLNADNRPVARVNGYRSVEDFKLVLDYVQQKAYEDRSLSQYIDAHKPSVYVFRDHPQLIETDDLQALGDGPVAVLFEDSGCLDCARLHDGYLAEPEVREVLRHFAFVRLDALSDEPLVDMAGKRTTPRAYAATLGLTYRPGMVLFDGGREIARIQSRLYRYHFTELLRYVGEGHYENYPASFYDYLDVRTAEQLASGQDVNLGE
jgi:thioredoxin-related protein